MSKTVKIGFIGYGKAARVFHLPFIEPNPNYQIYAFYQRAPAPANPEDGKGSHCTSDYPDAKHYTDLDEFLKDPEIEVVSVLTRHDTHSAFAEKALLAGKHGEQYLGSIGPTGVVVWLMILVVVEKPVGINHQEFKRAIDASTKSGKLLIPFQSTSCCRGGKRRIRLTFQVVDMTRTCRLCRASCKAVVLARSPTPRFTTTSICPRG